MGLASIFSGCESPADGASGSSGVNGPGTFTDGDIDAAALEAVYAYTDTVVLTSGVTSVAGEIPTGKKLVVAGDIPVKDGEALEVEGTLEIVLGAALDASYVSGTAGYLKGSGSVSGEGGVLLPYIAKAATGIPEGIITYTSTIEASKAAGSYIPTDASTPATTALDNDGVVALFALTDDEAIAELTVNKITDLTAAAIPAGKTLTLTGTGNTFTAALDLSSGGTLIVAEGAELEASGLLTVGDGTNTTGAVQNNGTIKTASAETTAANILSYITKPTGSGTVKITGDANLSTITAAAALTQNVEIVTGKTLTAPVIAGNAAPFSGEKTITVKGTLALGAAKTIGATVVNGGTVTTATTSAAALNTILALGGTITSSGAVAGTDAITVPAGTTFTHDTGTFVGGAGALTIEGAATFTTGTFADQTGKLTVNGKAEFTAATFATLTSLEVDGEAEFTAATFVAVTSLTVNGTLEAETATFTALTTVTGTGSVTAGVVSGVTATPKAQILIGSTLKEVSLATTTLNGALTIPASTTRIFTGDFEPDNTVTVNGLAVFAGDVTLLNALTIGTDGALALVSDKAITLGHASAKIADGSAYEIVPETSKIDGTLTAGENVVVFTAGAISGMDEDQEAAAATLALGTSNVELKIKAGTVLDALTLDVSDAGKITVTANQTLTLKLAGDDGVLSGAIFTLAVSGGTAGGAVKANAVTPKSSDGAIADAAALAAAKVEKAATATAAGDLATGGATTDAANGVITKTEAITIDKKDTFTVGAAGAITVTAVDNG
jgi:hypothetical protein